MTPSSISSLKTRTASKIRFLEDQLVALDHYLPETYEYLMQELDLQKRTLAELEVQEHFTQIDENDLPDRSTPE
jgi:hypothetical protein